MAGLSRCLWAPRVTRPPVDHARVPGCLVPLPRSNPWVGNASTRTGIRRPVIALRVQYTVSEAGAELQRTVHRFRLHLYIPPIHDQNLHGIGCRLSTTRIIQQGWTSSNGFVAFSHGFAKGERIFRRVRAGGLSLYRSLSWVIEPLCASPLPHGGCAVAVNPHWNGLLNHITYPNSNFTAADSQDTAGS